VLRVFTIATERKPTLDALVKSCHNKLDLEVTMHLGKWDWGIWLNWQMARCRVYPNDDLVFVDAYDTLFIGDPKELRELVASEPLVHSSCKECWPIKEREEHYPEAPGPWKFLNSCGPAGKGSAILKALDYGMSHFPYPHPPLDRDNDQRFWTDVYLSGFGSLDWDCRIWQDLHKLKQDEVGIRFGRLYNDVHKTFPNFIHASAGTWHLIPKEFLNGN
jgi:hypothetical protein